MLPCSDLNPDPLSGDVPQKVKSTDKKEALAAEAARIEGQLREDAARQKKLKFEQSLKVSS